MKRHELEITVTYKNAFVSRHHVPAKSKLVTIGQSPTANIRMMGEGVGSIHAMVEYNPEKGWTLTDTGSETGTWIKKNPITVETIKEETSVSIGSFTLNFLPMELESNLFESKESREATKGSHTFHQVIIRKGGFVVRTELLGPKENYEFVVGNDKHVLNPPAKDEWKETEFGHFKVQQRIVKSSETHLTMQERWRSLAMPEMRVPLMVIGALLFIVSTLVLFAPNDPDAELTEVKKENTYTKMIYDAKLLKKKREQIQQRRTVTKTGTANGGGGPGKESDTTPVHSKGAAPKIVSKIQGISALLGKISKRAAVNSIQIASNGRNPDSTPGPVTVAAVGSLQGVATQVGNGGNVFKVGGVGTLGKGGGNGKGLGAVGTLNSANVGNASVGILEEETEIEGGLDRDVIARVIQNQIGEIRYCYERQLSADPDLYGKVQVKFTIDALGSVVNEKVGVTTLNSASVEGCILRRLARWRFPKPKGGTQVLVTYPFMFKSTN